MRILYTLLVYLATPFVLAGPVWRGLTDRSHWVRAGERLGWCPDLRRSTLWIHAVSVGEVRAAAILVPHLQRKFPNLALLITTTTQTGAQQVRDLFGTTVHHCYLPIDVPGAVNRFLERTR